MSGIIEGFNYDIFLSYRQKDNRGDRWVSDFVDALKIELDKTFKEEISVYFDVNPHDGLLETHDVGESLKEKLKCLIFIPIISRTYCDPKAFAWEHEFRAFVRQASNDVFGLKIRLPNGNVACRVLPVGIHDLDDSDIKLCETVLGGVLRGVEFIYKEPGVNRPLTKLDDGRKNLNGTSYRNQINKVANAVKEIISGLRSEPPVYVTEEKKEVVFEETHIPGENSIAVLPFVDLSQKKDQEYFCDGVTEEIINALVHVDNFKVIARTSAFAFKNKQVDIREIGKKLDVEHILEGSIRKEGDRLRVTTQLVRVYDGSHIWSERYDRKMEDVFAVQDEISLAIVDKLKIKLLGNKKEIISRRHTDSFEAYNLYLRGTYAWQMLADEGYKKAIYFYEQALQKDPAYAIVYAGLASIHISSSFWGDVSPGNAYPEALDCINKALETDKNLGEAYSVLGLINTFYHRNWVKAEENFKHALHLNPNSSLIHVYYSFLLTCTRRNEEAIREVRRAQELDPLSAFINTEVGTAYAWSGEFDKAVEEYHLSLSINPNYYNTHYMLGNAYVGTGKLDLAISEREKAVNLSGGKLPVLAFLICGYYRIGIKDLADKLFDTLKKRTEKEYLPASYFYLIYKHRREENLAYEWFTKAISEHDSLLLWFITSPLLQFDEPKYQAFLKKYGLDILTKRNS